MFLRRCLVSGLLLAVTLQLALPAAAVAAGASREWILRCTTPGDAARLLASADPLPAGLRLEAVFPPAEGTPPALASMLRLNVAGALESRQLTAWRDAGIRFDWIEAQPIRRTDLVPDDSDYNLLWALPRIQAPQAWDQQRGEGEIVIAVVDTGADLDHPDLAGALWINQAEAAGTPGVDDDGNGWIDDLHGYDLQDGDADPSAEAGDLSHGTHTAGTAACMTDNGTGVACPAWEARLMVVRAGHSVSINRGAEGIWYAARSGADVISCSFGGDSYSNFEREVVAAAQDLGCLVVASAGNAGTDRLHYPGAYPGVLCVASTDPDDHKLPSSQYGWWVDLAAPGSSIWSTVMNGGYAYKSGTSMATPLVASLAALVWSRDPQEDGWQVQARVKASCDNIDALNPSFAGELGSGRVNALRLVSEEARALRLAGWVLDEPDGNGFADPGETVELGLQLAGVLGTLQGLQLQAGLPAGGGTMLDGSITAGTLAEGQLLDLGADPLRLQLSTELEPGEVLRIEVACSADDGFSELLQIELPVAPLYATHGNSELVLSLDGRGRLGYHDFEVNQPRGDGLRWPATSPSHLYHGTLVITRDDGQVTHGSSYLIGESTEFVTSPGGEVRLHREGEMLVSEAEYGSPELPGLLIGQRALSPDGGDWLLLEWSFHNGGDAIIDGFQPGLWLDLDIASSWNDDEGGWNFPLGFAWMGDSGSSMVAATSLDEDLASFRICRYGEWTGGGLEDAELFAFMRSGFTQTGSSGPDDWQLCLAAEANDLAVGEERHFRLLLAGGTDGGALSLALDEGRTWWASDVAAPVTSPQGWELELAPNPFNPLCRFALLRQEGGQLDWRLWNLRGELVKQGSAGWQPAGLVRGTLDLGAHASGQYLIEFAQGGQRMTTPILLLK